MNREQREFHLDKNGNLEKIAFWRVYKPAKKRFIHQGLGEVPIRAVFKYWNQKMGLNLKEATAAMARKTFCTFSERYFKFPMDQVPLSRT